MCSNFAHDAFNEMTNGHARRNDMWIHNDIMNNPLLCPWHISLSTCDAYYALLSMTTTELVPYLWYID
jgi:hypothetical protein